MAMGTRRMDAAKDVATDIGAVEKAWRGRAAHNGYGAGGRPLR